MAKRCVVTGASSGIGRATVRRLASSGWDVVGLARRADRLEQLASEISYTPVVCDITKPDNISSLVEQVGSVDALVNNAGGAIGLDYVADGDSEEWRQMYDVNVLGTLAVTQALLPQLISSGQGSIVTVTSTASYVSYEGGGGYCAAKHAEKAMMGALRLELCGEPVRVMQVAPGMVATAEFSLNRFRGDHRQADAVYDGVKAPLEADDIAECIRWMLDLPPHVCIDEMVVRPRDQAAQHKVHREN